MQRQVVPMAASASLVRVRRMTTMAAPAAQRERDRNPERMVGTRRHRPWKAVVAVAEPENRMDHPMPGMVAQAGIMAAAAAAAAARETQRIPARAEIAARE